MMDVARQRGIHIDSNQLSKELKVPVIPIIARTGQGCERLNNCIASEEKEMIDPLRLDYGPILEETIKKMKDLIPECNGIPKRWMAIQYLEGNSEMMKQLESSDSELKIIAKEADRTLKEEKK